MSHGYTSYSEVSKDGLKARVWRFFVTFDSDLHVVLDSYSEGVRESTRKKFRENGQFYQRLGRATHGETKLRVEDVPWPPYLTEKITKKVADMIVVSRAKEFNREAQPGVPTPDPGAVWEGAQETESVPMKR